MICTRHEMQFVVEERQQLERTLFRDQRHDREIVLVTLQAIERRIAIGNAHADIDCRIGRHELGKQMRGEVLRGGNGDDPQRTAHTAVKRGKRLARRIQAPEHVSGGNSHGLAFRSQIERAAHELDQPMAEHLLELANLRAHRGLRKSQTLARATEAVLGADGEKHLKLAKGDGQTAQSDLVEGIHAASWPLA